jgi:yeast amino acid transporter
MAPKDFAETTAEKRPGYTDDNEPVVAETEESLDGLHRRLSNRQIQWIAIGGSIGTALFVSIGWGLVEGGPGSLFLAFAIYSCFLAIANSCMAEMSIFMPVVGGWVRMGSRWVDESYGFMAGWNFFVRHVPPITPPRANSHSSMKQSSFPLRSVLSTWC